MQNLCKNYIKNVLLSLYLQSTPEIRIIGHNFRIYHLRVE